MSLRLPSQGVHSFISFYSCVRSANTPLIKARSLSFHRARHPNTSTSQNQLSRRSFHASKSSYAPKDPYQVLGVGKDATPAEIKKVYFSLARKYHPDTNPDKNAQEKFVEIQEAYDILKDEKKKAAYDQYGSASQQPGFDPNAFAQHPFGGGFGSGFGRAGGGSDLFDQLFGALGGRGRGGSSPFAQAARGADIEASIGVSFMEAAQGTSRTVKVNPVVDCGTCTGSGLKAGSQRSKCPTCNGSGTRTFVIDSGFQMASTCPTCQGAGTVIPRGHHCRDCDGVGKVRGRKSVKVDIPAGIEDGMTIRVPNAGDAPEVGKGPTGDLLVRVNVAASKTFRRQGRNIYHDARIPLHTALLGGRVRVPTLDGDVDVRVPGGTQQGQEMVLKHRGIQPVFGGEKGDLFVNFTVQIPRSLTDRQRQILQEYADDVEGRTAEKATKEPQERTNDPDANSSTSSDSKTPLNHDNGDKESEADDASSEAQEKRRATG